MKLLTKKIEKQLEKYPLYSQANKDAKGTKVLVKFFNPYGSGTWYVTEAEKQADGDWLFFGLVKLFEPELGYFSFNELKNLRVSVMGCKLPIERDMYFNGTLEDAYNECK